MREFARFPPCVFEHWIWALFRINVLSFVILFAIWRPGMTANARKQVARNDDNEQWNKNGSYGIDGKTHGQQQQQQPQR